MCVCVCVCVCVFVYVYVYVYVYLCVFVFFGRHWAFQNSENMTVGARGIPLPCRWEASGACRSEIELRRKA